MNYEGSVACCGLNGACMLRSCIIDNGLPRQMLRNVRIETHIV